MNLTDFDFMHLIGAARQLITQNKPTEAFTPAEYLRSLDGITNTGLYRYCQRRDRKGLPLHSIWVGLSIMIEDQKCSIHDYYSEERVYNTCCETEPSFDECDDPWS